MRLIILSIGLFIQHNIYGLDSTLVSLKDKDYSKIDSISKTYKSVDDAINKISTLNNEADKTRACFNFVASYMGYSHNQYAHTLCRQTFDISIKTKKGVCLDYSVLFKYICINVGLECVVVKGMVKNNNFELHAWNVVTIDSKLYILDVTFADAEIINSINYNSYLIPPEYSITYYYPITYDGDTTVIYYKNDGDFGILDFTNLKGFDNFYIKNKKNIDTYYSRACKYQVLEKPKSIYCFLHTAIKGDIKYYKPNTTDYIPLRQMPGNDPNLYMY